MEKFKNRNYETKPLCPIRSLMVSAIMLLVAGRADEEEKIESAQKSDSVAPPTCYAVHPNKTECPFGRLCGGISHRRFLWRSWRRGGDC
jgi:hypothetical protein